MQGKHNLSDYKRFTSFFHTRKKNSFESPDGSFFPMKTGICSPVSAKKYKNPA